MGPDKTRIVIDKYPTLPSLLRAYSKADSFEAKARILSDIHQTGGRKIGITLSDAIGRIYNAWLLPGTVIVDKPFTLQPKPPNFD